MLYKARVDLLFGGGLQTLTVSGRRQVRQGAKVGS